jgi:hypothetical protein
VPQDALEFYRQPAPIGADQADQADQADPADPAKTHITTNSPARPPDEPVGIAKDCRLTKENWSETVLFLSSRLLLSTRMWRGGLGLGGGFQASGDLGGLDITRRLSRRQR